MANMNKYRVVVTYQAEIDAVDELGARAIMQNAIADDLEHAPIEVSVEYEIVQI